MMHERATRLTALMAGHGLTFLQVYTFYVETVQGLTMPHLRAQVVSFMAAMVIGVVCAYGALMIRPDERKWTRRGLEAASALILLTEWFVLGRAFLYLH